MSYSLSLKSIYLPFFYLEKVKRINEKYTVKVILWDDFPLLLFAFAWQANHMLLKATSILFLLISFWCVYETGYYENDLVAERYEDQPKLSKSYYENKTMMESRLPWLWSFVFGLIGIVLLEKSQGIQYLFGGSFLEILLSSVSPILLMALYWTTFLLLTRICFWIYNNLNKRTRVWLYIVLQSFRYYGFLAVTSLNPIGTSLLSGNILSRSILYVIYRYVGGSSNEWPSQVPEKVLRCLIFIFILSAISFSVPGRNFWQDWQTWAIISWCFLQGKGQFIRILSQVKPVFEDGSNQIKSVS